MVRCYSLSDAPARREQHYRLTVKQLAAASGQPAGLASSYLAERVKEGDILDVMAPSGQFYLDMTSDRPLVLLAGGVGLTPLLSMFLSIAEAGSRRQTWLFYGARNRNEHLMADTLRQLAAEHDNLHLVVCYSRPTDNCQEGRDYDVAGHIDVALLQRSLPSNNFHLS